VKAGIQFLPLARFSLLVIPAKAGIQCLLARHSRESGNPVFSFLEHELSLALRARESLFLLVQEK
jgi:hypothetical protein